MGAVDSGAGLGTDRLRTFLRLPLLINNQHFRDKLGSLEMCASVVQSNLLRHPVMSSKYRIMLREPIRQTV